MDDLLPHLPGIRPGASLLLEKGKERKRLRKVLQSISSCAISIPRKLKDVVVGAVLVPGLSKLGRPNRRSGGCVIKLRRGYRNVVEDNIQIYSDEGFAGRGRRRHQNYYDPIAGGCRHMKARRRDDFEYGGNGGSDWYGKEVRWYFTLYNN